VIFSSPLFLFVFLPVVLAGYYAMPPRVKNAFLLLASLVFYAWGEPIYVALLVASIVGNYAFGLAIDRTHSTVGRRLVVTLAVLGNLAFLAYFKYFSFALVNFFSADSAQALASAAPDHLPLGISFFTFQALSYIIDVYRRTSPAQANPFSLALFISSFPQMIAGPIIRYADVQRQIEFRVHEAHLFVSGVRRFVFGLAKKVLIADVLGDSADQIFAEDAEDLSAGAIWLGIVCFAFQIYFDFSAYSDMAIGLGRMFGFRFKENFNYPYISRSLTEMWERWHISLGSWFRDYLYIPLGGNRHGAFRTHLNLWTVFLLCGLWHGASWNFVIWGALHGSVLVIERLGLGRLLQRTWAPLHIPVHINILPRRRIARCHAPGVTDDGAGGARLPVLAAVLRSRDGYHPGACTRALGAGVSGVFTLAGSTAGASQSAPSTQPVDAACGHLRDHGDGYRLQCIQPVHLLPVLAAWTD
jgi:alginate O-acetyltransferase complex protein AlgI